MGTLDGKVALVTGASRGIGATVALRLASEGARVAAMARTLDPDPRYSGSLRETVESIRAAGHEAVAVRGDLSSAEDRRRIVAETVEAFGPVDILVNNAAVTFLAPVEEFSEKRFRLMIEVQVWAPFELTQLVLPGMRARGAGWLLNISSRAAQHPEGPPFDAVYERGFSAYGLCKAALERFTTAVASEGYRHGIRANALAPLDNVATPGAGAHDLVADFPLEDPSVLAEAALALVEGDITGRIAYSQTLLDELGRKPAVTAG
ncbi:MULTISPECIES: SDR family NAD(P)-dependent oxidoreductase [unclassified Frankia]|uniref:SDR family NAD(P)-dependent oxidoreductase n=1 Tax=unclassified Frankia TaxID=2632575 RepID=UPI001EF4910D|nr:MULTISPECIES: SDR family NAD(P)-dependent oxidoreductase [unclassified Frankia]